MCRCRRLPPQRGARLICVTVGWLLLLGGGQAFSCLCLPCAALPARSKLCSAQPALPKELA